MAQGLLTAHQLRATAWRQLLRGVYADSTLPVDHGLLCQAAGLLLPAGSVVAGPSAAWLHGVHDAGGADDPVHMIVPDRKHQGPRQGVRLHISRTPPPAVRHSGLLLTDPTRTVCDLALWCPTSRAVPILIGMLRIDLVRMADIDAVIEAQAWAGQRGWRQAAHLVRVTRRHLARPQRPAHTAQAPAAPAACCAACPRR